jgi:hypothetical protein
LRVRASIKASANAFSEYSNFSSLQQRIQFAGVNIQNIFLFDTEKFKKNTKNELFGGTERKKEEI